MNHDDRRVRPGCAGPSHKRTHLWASRIGDFGVSQGIYAATAQRALHQNTAHHKQHQHDDDTNQTQQNSFYYFHYDLMNKQHMVS